MSHWRNGIVLALLLAGCGANQDPQRDAADRYVRAAQAAMTRDAAGLQAANDAYVAFSRGKLDQDDAIEKMRAAEQAITGVRNGVIVLDHPAPVDRLHTRLVHYLDLNRDLAAQTTELAVYTPAAEAALAPVVSINRRLSKRLEHARDVPVQARALATFEQALGGVTDDLRALAPPPILAPTHRDQLRRLDTTRRLAGQLRHALAQHDATRVTSLLKRFRAASNSSGGLHALQRQAEIGYAQRLTRLRDAYVQLQRETTSLARDLYRT